MNRKSRQLLIGLVLVGISLPVLADNFDEARTWLERMAQAMREQTYQGTFVYVRGQDVETMRVTHVRDDHGVRERMYALSGPVREIIRDSNGVRCLLSERPPTDADTPLAQTMFPVIPLEELDQARARYLFEVGDTARIAGHQGRRVSILPRDQYRYGYDFWLQEDSALLLRWTLYDAARKPLAKLMFTDLRTGDQVDASELESSTPSDKFVRLAAAGDDQAQPQPGSALKPQWEPARLPPGFRLAALNYRSADDPAAFEHLVYSDGLASVSVYIEFREAAKDMREGLSRLGTSNAFSKRAGSRQVTAIGDVPAITVQAIGNAFAGPVAAAD